MTTPLQTSCELSEKAPFTTVLVESSAQNLSSTEEVDTTPFLAPLPTIFRRDSSDLATVASFITQCIDKELDVTRLNNVYDLLWLAGRPVPPRPLHHQLLIGRAVCLTEQMDMHLVWATGQIYLKPLPRFLLEPLFWEKHLSCPNKSKCPQVGRNIPGEGCTIHKRRRLALGFLFSYVALIIYESDFLLAKEKHLLPSEVTWRDWKAFVAEIFTAHIYADVDKRFHYGELRLSRLDLIYYFWQTPFRFYVSQINQYSSFFSYHFTTLASITIYIAVILSAMQVGLSTKLGSNNAFQSASYGFTIFSILGPISAMALVTLYAFVNLLLNIARILRFRKMRFREIGGGNM